MHSYTADESERQRATISLMVLSVAAAWALPQVLRWMNVSLAWWIDAPSVVGFYGLLTAFFNRFGWRFGKRLHLVRMPDLAGKWEGMLTSSYDNHATQHAVSIQVEQTWTKILVTFRASDSVSHSTTASLLADGGDGASLVYTYMNEPKMAAKDSMQIHRGTVYLSLRAEGDEEVLEGEYYTGRSRTTYGTLLLKKVQGIA